MTLWITGSFGPANALDGIPNSLLILLGEFNTDCTGVIFQVFDVFGTWDWDEVFERLTHKLANVRHSRATYRLLEPVPRPELID